MKVSIITVSYNSKDFIKKAIESVLSQSYIGDIEYIIIDGGSSDGTVDIIKRYQDRIAYWVSEKDNGIFDGMNKGLRVAEGEIVGFLNSDDLYVDDEVIKDIVETMDSNQVDSCYGDVVYVHKYDTDRIVRYWKSQDFYKERFRKGWMPPHPAFFVRKDIYDKYGLFNLDFPISADYEIMLRFLYRYNISTQYLPRVLVKMSIGGNSNRNLKNIINGNRECYRAWEENGLRVSPWVFLSKPLGKISQVFLYPSKSGINGK